MKNISFLLAFLLVLPFMPACTKNQTEPGPQPVHLSHKSLELLKESNDFSLELFRDILTHDTSANLMVSPLSISLALGMTYNGADGTTKEAFEKTLHLDGMSVDDINSAYQELQEKLLTADPKVIMEIANSIWYRDTYPVAQSFIDVNKKFYKAEVSPLDFGDPASVDIINNWVKEKTHEKIDRIIEQIDSDNIMFLINAIYFKGTWKYQFNKEETTEQPFYDEAGNIITRAEMMGMKSTVRYYNDEALQAVDLPYGDGNYCMTVLLPAGNNTLEGLVSGLTKAKWDQVTGGFTETEVNVFLPKFKIEFKKELKDPLSRLGLGIAFDPLQADFRKINPGMTLNLYISSVKHKTFVETDEEGTEAAAVTAVTINELSALPGEAPVITFRADRPFLFIIREQTTGAILFTGKVGNPKDER